MGRKTGLSGVRGKGNRIEIEFQFEGKRYRPTFARIPTEANLSKQLQEIKARIAAGNFNFEEEFPDYRFLKDVQSAPQSEERVCDQVFDDFLEHCSAPVTMKDLAFVTLNGDRKSASVPFLRCATQSFQRQSVSTSGRRKLTTMLSARFVVHSSTAIATHRKSPTRQKR